MAVECVAPGAQLMSPGRPASHSYQGQDLFVVEALGGLRGGFFLDSGASDGVSGSNSLLLESQFGWQGICVEPNTDSFARLVRARSCACVNCCLYDRPGDVSFFEAAGVLGGIVDEYDSRLLVYARFMVEHHLGAEIGPVTKKARTVRSVLREHDAPRVIDYWSLDTEGSEFSILTSFPWDEYVVRVLTVEHNNNPVRETIRRFLETRGYLCVRTLGIDDGYLLRPAASISGWRSHSWSRSGSIK